VDGYFLVVSDNGILSCFEAQSGKRTYMQRIGTRYSASPIAASGLAYFTSDDGVTTVVRPGEKLDVVAENRLGQACFASPAVSEGRLYFRGENELLAIGE
jgi:outer membrane protein assembly factor BamB